MGLEGSGNPPVTKENGIRLSQALLGTTIPILIGQQRLSWKLLWYGAFKASQAKQQGGSGLSKGGVQYVYSASVVGSVCLGDCVNFLAVWDSVGRFAVLSTSDPVYTITAGSTPPYSYTPALQTAFKHDLGVNLLSTYSVTANDYGSPGSITQSGTQNTPLVYTSNPSPGPGQYTIDFQPVVPVGGGDGGVSTFSITSVNNASGGNTVYNGTITGGGSNAYANFVFSVKGSNFPANNGQFTCVASSATTLTLANPTGVADTAVMLAIIINSLPIYIFNPSQNGAQIVVNYVAYRYRIIEEELNVVPGNPWIVTVQFQGEFYGDLGVKYYPSGIALTGVSGSPGVGQYNPNGGNYEFNSGDQGQGVSISYSYSDPNQDNNAPGTINLTFFSGALGQTPWSYLTSSFPANAIGYSETAYVASSGLYLGFSPLLPQYNFEIAGPYAFGNGIPDANPADAIYGLLTASIYKLNFPVSNIGSTLLGTYSIAGSVTSGTFTAGEVVTQSGTGATTLLIGTVTGSSPMNTRFINGPADGVHGWVGQTSGAIYTPTSLPTSSSVRSMWSANNFFISDVLDSQQSLMSIISKWCEAGQSYIAYDEGLLKFIPLVDTTCVANGAVYSPPTQPVIDLDDNDFVTEPGKDPIEIEQSPWQNRWNRVGVRWTVRTNDYNEDIYQVQDEASVQQFGLMYESAQDFQFITTLNAAQFAGNMRLQRYSAIFTTYKFTLKANFAFLSPGDIITITDGLLNTSGTMFGRTPVRITKMIDNPQKGIDIEAETFPWSVGASLLNNVQAQLPSNTNDGPQEDPGNTVPVIFEVPNRAQKYAGGTVYIFANGSNVNWGGFQLWVSYNGVDYNYYDQYTLPARLGVLTASSTSAVFTLTQVAVSGPTVTYSYSSFTGTISVPGAFLVVAGFTNTGNNSTIQIVTISGGGSGTFTAAFVAQVNETHAGTATGGFPTSTAGQNSLDSSNVLEVNMQQSGAVLQSVTAADRDAFVTLSAIVSPGQSFIETQVAQTGTIIGTSTGGGTTSGTFGPVNPTSATQVSGTNANPWSNLTGIEGNSSYATCNLVNPGNGFTYSLFGTKFNIVVPPGAGAIIGLQIKFTAFYTAATFGSGEIFLTYLGSLLGTEHFLWNGAGPPTTPTVFTVGSLTDLTVWGFSSGYLTPTILNDPSFGFIFLGSLNNVGSSTLEVKNFTVEVAWAAGGAGSGWINPNNVSSAVSYVTATLTYSSITQYLVASNYNFNLPFGFVLDGIVVTVNAFVNTGTATLSASLFTDSLVVGVVKSASINSTPTDISFGTPTDLWGGQQYEDLDSLNSINFGVAFQAFGTISNTISLNNVRVTLYGTSTTNLELISYETATLTGQNTYALSSIRRGVYGSYPCDHQIGSTFARLDQASITYQIDPTFTGTTIFFKFLSFNAYGNQLQQLSSVVAYDLPVGGLAPGAIDQDTGALLKGIGLNPDGSIQWTVPQVSAVTAAAHGTFGIQNIPAGYGWVVPGTGTTGIPQWVPVISGGGGSGTVVNLFVISISGNFTAAAWDDLICDTTAGNITVTFPLASTSVNTGIGVIKLTADTNTVIITPSGGDTIQGNATLVLSYQSDAVFLISDGISNWQIMCGWVQPANDVYIYVPVVAGTYVSSQEIYFSTPTRSFTLPGSLQGSHAGCRVAPSGNVQFTLLKNGSSIGTINIASGATTATFTFSTTVTINGTTDTFSITAPSPADGLLTGFWADLLATRSL